METGIYGAPLLTPEKVRTTRFKFTGPMLVFPQQLLGVDFVKKITDIEAKGGAADLFGWPDGTTIFWEHPSPDTPLDEDMLVEAYYAFHRAAKLSQTEVDFNACTAKTGEQYE